MPESPQREDDAMTDQTIFQAAGSIIGLADIGLGLTYAVFGSAKISVNGRRCPNWLSFTFRLLAPMVVLGATLFGAAAPQPTEPPQGG